MFQFFCSDFFPFEAHSDETDGLKRKFFAQQNPYDFLFVVVVIFDVKICVSVGCIWFFSDIPLEKLFLMGQFQDFCLKKHFHFPKELTSFSQAKTDIARRHMKTFTQIFKTKILVLITKSFQRCLQASYNFNIACSC